MPRPSLAFFAALAALALAPAAAAQETILVGIGTQHTTTNTVTGGIVIEKLGLLEKHLPKGGKYAGKTIKVEWSNFTSGPPITNGMVADKLQIGMMGDYPLIVNGGTFQAQGQGVESKLIALIAYNENGAGNGLVVHKDSPYFDIADLKGKNVSVPFGSAAHGMLLKVMKDRGWKQDFWNLASQTPEVGATSIQERKIDGHANFVPFAELLPFRGYARKIFDGAETKLPTFHGVVVRSDFAAKYPEIVQAYLNALLDANEWVRKNPKEAAEKIQEWTKIDKEVVYIFLGPGGIMTLDPTIKAKWIETAKVGVGVLQGLGRLKDLDTAKWVDDSHLRAVFKARGLDYDKQLASFANYAVAGADIYCKTAVADSKLAGEIWVEGGEILPSANPTCTLAAVAALEKEGKKVRVAYTVDQALGIKLFADKAYYASGKGADGKPVLLPYLIKRDAEAKAKALGGAVIDYRAAVAQAASK